MNNDKRLIEVAFPLREASIDSVHERNQHRGHIGTLHIWPARRPLAASRAALIATLLAAPTDRAERSDLVKRLGGTLHKVLKKKKMPNGRIEEIEAYETTGGVLRWGREATEDMNWFRGQVLKAYGGRAPRVLDPFSGGGAIPLEAMRLGCEATAADINPVSWFVLKCTLEYPQRFAGQKRILPEFAVQSPAFMEAYLKAQGLTATQVRRQVRKIEQALIPQAGADAMSKVARGESLSLLDQVDLDPALLSADLGWHVRAWGYWVLVEARKQLSRYYPTYAEYCTLEPSRRVPLDTGEELKLVPMNEAGEPQVDLLNAGFDVAHLENPKQARWVAKPTLAYLWTRTVKCKACRAELPLLKTFWLAKKDNKRVVLTLTPRADKSGVEFDINQSAKAQGGNAAQRREHDKRIGAGTMSRAGAACPCCPTIMTMEDLRLEARADRLGARMYAVVVDGPDGKEYRLPTAHELEVTRDAGTEVDRVFADIPFGLPTEPLAGADALGFRVPLYGLDQWHKLFAPRQLVALGTIVKIIRNLPEHADSGGQGWREALVSYLSCVFGKSLDYGNALASWYTQNQQITHLFNRFALPMKWDFAEAAPLGGASGSWESMLESVSKTVDALVSLPANLVPPKLVLGSATQAAHSDLDVVVTDPPYYDAIPYSDLMDFFYVWHRRLLTGLSDEFTRAFSAPLAPKWDHGTQDGELIDDSSRFGGSREASKRNYEQGMARAFLRCNAALKPDGRLVIVFAHKQPDAWETLVTAIIKAGFVVDGSWPIQTEMSNRTRALSSAALASSVWLVCRKRDPLARAGWDTQVLKDMEAGITTKLREFWDAGIRGPDFIWAATGPAMESYSRYPAVKKASEPGAFMSVTDFLGHVRRIVVDFVVGRVLSHGQSEPTPGDHPLDDVTTYYLLHRNDFGLKDAPAGPCILYAVSCGLSERELADQYELLARSGGVADAEDEEAPEDDEGDDAEEPTSSGGGGKYKLKDWRVRKHRSLGMELASGRAIPLIDQIHKLMQLWVAGDVVKVNDFLDSRALRRSQVFAQLIQALIETSRAEGCTDECSILERLQNYLRQVGSTAQTPLGLE